jgi:hypothetical protein
MTVALLLAMCSEFDRHFNFGFKDRIIILWGILSDRSAISKELYEKRYKPLLAS